MSVLKSAENLVIGNGDLFLASSVADLPSTATYQSNLAAGTLTTTAGNVGAIKGTVSLQIIREMVQFELGIPQETADMTCIREGIHLKCMLAELSMQNLQTQIGGGLYSTIGAGATEITAEAHTATQSGEGYYIAIPLGYGPLLTTGSTPSAPADILVYNATTTTTTDTGGSDFDSTSATTGNVVSTTHYVAGTVLLIGTEQILVGTVASGTQVTGCTRGYNSTSAAAHASGSTVTILYVAGSDYSPDDITGTVTPTADGNIYNGAPLLFTYYYNALSSETLTVGGQASVIFSAVRFFHPYAWGGVLTFTMFKAAPVGQVTVPFEEVAYSNSELEMRGIADYTRAVGANLFQIDRQLPA